MFSVVLATVAVMPSSTALHRERVKILPPFTTESIVEALELVRSCTQYNNTAISSMGLITPLSEDTVINKIDLIVVPFFSNSCF